MPYGRYCVREIQPLEGYGDIEEFDVEIWEDQKTYYYILENHPIQSYVRIEKRDAATGEVIPVAGAKFQMVNEKTGEEVRYKIYYPTEQWLCEFETDDSGTLTLPGPLGYGRDVYKRQVFGGVVRYIHPCNSLLVAISSCLYIRSRPLFAICFLSQFICQSFCRVDLLG